MTDEALEYIQLRCSVCDGCGERWHWLGPDNGNGHPKVYSRRLHKYVPARREVWEVAKCEKLRPGQMVTTTCTNGLCLNPELLAITNKAEVSRKSMARPDVKLRQRVHVAQTKRRAEGKITMEIARGIRASNVSAKDIAAVLHVSKHIISNVRRGRSWVEHVSPLAGLGAR